MTLAFVSILSFVSTVEASSAIACSSSTDLIKSLPYWNPKDAFPCMYSGTINTKVGTDHNLFYWLFKNLADASLPLVLWINGGPGSSSMFALFLENGPLRVNKTGPTNDDYQIYMNPEGSWVDVANVIFLD